MKTHKIQLHLYINIAKKEPLVFQSMIHLFVSRLEQQRWQEQDSEFRRKYATYMQGVPSSQDLGMDSTPWMTADTGVDQVSHNKAHLQKK